MISMVVFDMAGTTVNEDNVVYKTLQKAIKKKGFDFTLDQVLAEGAGKEKLEAVQSILKKYARNTDKELANEIYSDFMDLLSRAYEDIDVLPQPNAEELFQILKKSEYPYRPEYGLQYRYRRVIGKKTRMGKRYRI